MEARTGCKDGKIVSNTKDSIMINNLTLINDNRDTTETATEYPQLSDLENSIRSTLPSLSQFIALLYQINRQNLYQPHYLTFKLYCAEKWAIDSRMVVMLHQMLNCLEEQGEDFKDCQY